MLTTKFVEDVEKPETTTTHVLKKRETSDNSLEYSDTEIDEYLNRFLDMNEDAKESENTEKQMTLREGLEQFPKAAFWSMVLSTAIIMEGFDTNLLGSFYAFPAFQQKFGEYYPQLDEYQIPAKWQTSLSMAVYVGEVFGLLLAGLIADRIGYRKTLMGGMTCTGAFIFIVFFAPSVGVVLVGELLLGVPWGMFQTLTVSYASEVCPMVLRLYLTTYVNCCWIIGQLISSGVLKGVLSMESAKSYQIPWGLQWLWVPLILTGLYFAPESPWWLVKKGRLEEARHSLRRLISKHEGMPDVRIIIDHMVKKMQLTIKEEEELVSGVTYFDCFRKNSFRRTRIAAMVWLIQNITGSALMGYSTYFYVQAGLSSSMSFTFSIIQYALGLIGTAASWILSRKLGRFDIFFGGLIVNLFVLITVGALHYSKSSGASWAIGSLLLIFAAVYDASVGPLTYTVVAEIPSTRLRTKTIIIARSVYNIAGIIIAIITPYMLNPTAWNWGSRTGFFWAGFTFLSIIWCWFEMPETKGRTVAELDLLFKDGTPARKFKSEEVQTFVAQDLVNMIGEKGIKDLVNSQREEIHEEKA